MLSMQMDHQSYESAPLLSSAHPCRIGILMLIRPSASVCEREREATRHRRLPPVAAAVRCSASDCNWPMRRQSLQHHLIASLRPHGHLLWDRVEWGQTRRTQKIKKKKKK